MQIRCVRRKCRCCLFDMLLQKLRRSDVGCATGDAESVDLTGQEFCTGGLEGRGRKSCESLEDIRFVST